MNANRKYLNLQVIIATLFASIVTGSIVYVFCQKRSEEMAFQIHKGCFVASLNFCQKMRAGNFSDMFQLMENHCFSEANTLMAYDAEVAKSSVTKNLLKELAIYRSQYSNTSSNWTFAEQVLEKKLQSHGFK